MNDIIAMISSLGFPIVAAVGMGWYVNKLTDKHEKEIKDLASVIESNTRAIEKLARKLDKE